MCLYVAPKGNEQLNMEDLHPYIQYIHLAAQSF